MTAQTVKTKLIYCECAKAETLHERVFEVVGVFEVYVCKLCGAEHKVSR